MASFESGRGGVRGAWRAMTQGMRVLLRRDAADAELSEELRDYVARATAEGVAQGLSPEAAQRAALIETGSATSVQDHVRGSGWENAAAQFAADVRYGARQLLRNPGFAIVAVLTLALGIGATTAIFSAVNPVLFEPLPYPQAERVVMVWEARGSDGGDQNPTYGSFYELTQRADSAAAAAPGAAAGAERPLEFAAVARPWQPALVGDAEPERVEGQRVTPDYFRVLGVAPALGRNFAAADDLEGAARVAIVSERFWRRRLLGDPAIVGRQVTLDGASFTVIGVMPRGFENVLAPGADVWTTLRYDPTLPANGREWGHHLMMTARLSAGVSARAAAAELSAALEPLKRLHAAGYESSGGAPRGMMVRAMRDDLTAGVKPALLAILGAVILLLLIACINVSNLVLARGSARRGEFAVRAALGAGRARLVRQMLAEGLLLAACGGALGMVVAVFGVRGIVALSPAGLLRLSAVRVDGFVLLWALGVTCVAGVLVGLLPALYASGGDPQSALGAAGRSAVSGGHGFARRALVVAEISISLVLLVAAGLMLRSIRKIFSVDAGFDASRVVVMRVQDSGIRTTAAAQAALAAMREQASRAGGSGASANSAAANGDAASRARGEELARFYDAALREVRAVAGVEAAGFTTQLPLSGDFDVYGVEIAGKSNGASASSVPAFRYAVSPGYFEAMRIPLRRGRFLDERDKPGAPVAVVIDETFASREFAGVDPIGQRMRMGPDAGVATAPWAVVVGVVGDVRQVGLDVAPREAFYVVDKQWAWMDPAEWLVVRTTPGVRASSVVRSVKEAVWRVDRNQPIVRASAMRDLVAESEQQRRFALVLFEAFGIVAMLLAATGIYGVLAGAVTERTREIGVRTAFGATPRNIFALIVREGMRLACVGVAIGIVGAVAASSVMVTLLFGVTRLDVATYAGVSAVLLGVAFAACGVPALRAMRMNPIAALRDE
jgi:putative ABC transport system permease protein